MAKNRECANSRRIKSRDDDNHDVIICNSNSTFNQTYYYRIPSLHAYVLIVLGNGFFFSYVTELRP
jgi:hypothetical protein